MIRRLGILAALALVALAPAVAEAQNYGGGGMGGYVNTPFGAYSMQQMMQGGGNLYAADELRQYQMMQQQMQQQQQMMQQQQQYQQQMEQMKKLQAAQGSPDTAARGPISKKKKKIVKSLKPKGESLKAAAKADTATPAKAETAEMAAEPKAATKP